MQWCCNYEGFYLWLAWWETLVYDSSHGIYTTWREVKSGACRASWFIYINSIWNLRQKKIVSLGQSTSNWRYTLKSTQGTLHNWFKETLISLEQSRPCWVHAQNVTANMMLRLQGGLRHHAHTPQMRNGALSCAPKTQPFLRTCSLTSHCVLASVPRGRSQLIQRMDLYFLIWEEMAPQPKKLRKLAAAANAAKSLQSCPTLCNSRDGSPPGSPVPGILQARTLEWVTISFSNAWKWKVKVKSLTRVQLLATPGTAAQQAPPPMGFSTQEYWSGVPLPSPGNWLMDTNGLGWGCLWEKWVGVHTKLVTDSGETWDRRGWGDMKSVYWCWLHLPVLHSFVFLHCFSTLAFSVLLDGHSKSMCFVLSIKGSETKLFLLYVRFSIRFCFYDFLIEVYLNYSIVLISHVEKSDSIMHAYIYI